MRILDLKTYAKFLLRNKLYTTVSVVGLSISLMFVIVLGVYVKQQLSVDDFQVNKNRIFIITSGDEIISHVNPLGDYVKDRCPEVESYCRLISKNTSVNSVSGEILSVSSIFADSTFFTIFSFKLIEGSSSQVLENKNTVVISKSFAQSFFGNISPLGKSIVINGNSHFITGVFDDFPNNTIFKKTDLIINYNSIQNFAGWGNNILNHWGVANFNIFFLIKDGADISSKSEILLQDFKKDYFLYMYGWAKDVTFVPLKNIYFFNDRDSSFNQGNINQIKIYLGITFFILLIAILNYINLTVAQAGFRGKEAALRKLMGCTRRQLVVQFLTESLLMAVFSSLLALLFSILMQPFFSSVLDVKLDILSYIDLLWFLEALIFIVFISSLSGIIPALIVSRFEPIEVVKGRFAWKVKTGYSRALIIFQYIIALVLLICSVFIRQQADFLLEYDMGFNRDRILVMDNLLDSTQMNGFKNELLTIPGVEHVSFSMGTPLDGGNNRTFYFANEELSFQLFAIDSAFLKIYGIKLEPIGVLPDNPYYVTRRGFNALHLDSTNLVANIDGMQVNIGGIISDIKVRSLFDSADLIFVYWADKNKANSWLWNISIKIADNANLLETTNNIKRVYSGFNGGRPYESYFVDDEIQSWYQKETKMSSIMAAFTVLTIVIMVMGVFAMSLYMIRQKEKEIAIRKVNGATENEVLLMLNRGSIVRVLIAFVIAAPVAYYAMNKWLDNFAYKIGLSWWVFLAAGVVVLLLTVISVSYQTWKATRANPIKYLKNE